MFFDDDHSAARRCLLWCDALSRHTEVPGTITRRYLTPPMSDVHADIARWMEAAQMSVRVDAAGNLIGRRGGDGSHVLIIGSHLDTVPDAGRYDGILGVMIGIAVVSRLADTPLPFAIDVIGFSEEEGVRFSYPYIGSRVVAGDLPAAALELVDGDGVTLREAMRSLAPGVPGRAPGVPGRAAGSVLTGGGDDGLTAGLAAAAYDPDRVIGFVEPHIEQGPVLSRQGAAVAAVDAIVGQSRCKLTFHGTAAHAGTMPMSCRADALVAAARCVTATSLFAKQTPGLHATVGCLDVHPNVRNVVPGRVTLTLDVRHADDSIRRDAMERLCRDAIEQSAIDGIGCEVTSNQDQAAVRMDRRLSGCLVEAIADARQQIIPICSGAGHDAAVMSSRFPSAMLFLRQPKGISHHPDEDVDVTDVAVAIGVLCRFIQRLATQS